MKILCLYVLFIFIYALTKKIKPFSSFQKGVEDGLKIAITILPNLFALTFAVDLLTSCGLLELFIKKIPNLFLPIELFFQCFLKPLSSSSALLFMLDIYEKYGVNSIYGKLSSVIQGCSDTTFYVITMYFGVIKLSKTKYAYPAGLLTDFTSFVLCILFFFFLTRFISF